MADLNIKGQVKSFEQIRASRLRQGYCETCKVEPVKCFDIRKRLGGVIRERIPLTIPGEAYEGICLHCHPAKDPDGGRRKRRQSTAHHRHNNGHHSSYTSGSDHHYHPPQDPRFSPGGGGGAAAERRGSRPLPYNLEPDPFQNTLPVRGSQERVNSVPTVGTRRPSRQAGFRDLSQSMPSHVRAEEDMIQQLQQLEYGSDDQGDNEPEQAPKGREYVEEEQLNIFGERVMVRKPVPRRRKTRDRRRSSPKQLRGANLDRRTSPQNNSPQRRQNSGRQLYQNQQSSPQPQTLSYEEKEEEQEAYDSFDLTYGQSSGRRTDEYGNGHHGMSDHRHFQYQPSGRSHHLQQQQNLPSIPDLAPLPPSDYNIDNEAAPAAAGTNNRESTSSNSNGSEPLDALAQLIAQHCAKNPQETVKFVPGSGTVLPNSELVVEEDPDDLISVLTPDTYFQGRGSIATMATMQKSRRTNLTAISENSSGASSKEQQRSLSSHAVREPPVVPTHDVVSAPVTQDMESYLEESAPHLLTLRELVGQCTAAGADAEAIVVVTTSLIHDNATSMSMDLALFCLTTLWVLARKSDENKRKIIFEDATFDAIIEAMQIYRERSSEIQTRACGVLWSLSMDPADRKHIAQGGGCEAILNAMLVYTNEDALQVMALGALKVLSFDTIGKSTLRSQGALSIVADIMQTHKSNPTIQSEGCVILGNLAVDEASQSVAPVSSKEVEAVVSGILAHPDSLEVHEAACFTLMSLASSSINVDLIRDNNMSRLALELAFQKHPDDVGISILTLLRRLKFDSPQIVDRKAPPIRA